MSSRARSLWTGVTFPAVAFAALRLRLHVTARLRGGGAIVVLLALTLAALALVTLDSSALGALPALLLPALLAVRRYPGERVLASLSDRPRRGGRLRPRLSKPLAVPGKVALPRGGLLLAFSLAVRPPPGASPAAS